ncbi:hypothetical protein A2767_05130 [Candidatus Roizmanbacteria bacterium RIFCSPHIGHO2_01_FULL_35_10]|uniref:NYN domain-containing protein n=1 Tax=Candidatus Roizmanbacteria bacterium RIFCSPLOWO2_01_FULL_35_13 TaxID=1802055 RepID=A0A1F7IBG3_9BACT|nr:MAG: hypothetical protein A2767_05130 [Candidatus Roizmanbacteria bacterium RIFCSPHIGHO2_01_FULL_35_10]OGK40705.1 MAG: hypothetical protein A3A74_03750 [Candidatus Roizmanbacteria bacterium RIFCSPLOWO2_01_FULL_35_13]
MNTTILFIDGENFVHKIEEVLENKKINKHKIDIASVNFSNLFNKTLSEFKLSRKIFYAAKLHFHPETRQKSEELIKLQRKLRNNLINQGYEFVMAGNVRAQKIGNKIIFREKGVDVKIAVDLVSFSADKLLKTAILCSSDSDLQPVIEEAKKRHVEVIYLGFEMQPNKGLTYTTNRTVLFRNSEILEACGVK